MRALCKRPRRILALAVLGLAAPLPTFALAGGDEVAAEPATLTVSAALDRCGTADAQILCKIDASWNSIPAADEYAVSVTRADGSVVEYGDGGAAGTSLWVPYVGSGTYAVQVTAYGSPPDEKSAPAVLAADQAVSAAREGGSNGHSAAAPTAPGTDRDVDAATDAADGSEAPLPESGDGGVPGEERPPACEEPLANEPPTPEEPPSEEPGSAADELAEELDGLTEATESALETEGELPDGLTCTTP